MSAISYQCAKMRVIKGQFCTWAIHGGHPLVRAYPTTRPTFPQSHAWYNNYMARDVCHSVPSPLSCESRWRRWYMRTAHVCGPSQIRLRARCFRNPTHVRIITWIEMCATKCLVRFIEHGNGQGTYCWRPAGRCDHAPDVSAIPRMLITT